MHDTGLVQEFTERKDGGFNVLFWCESGALAKLIGNSDGRIKKIE